MCHAAAVQRMVTTDACTQLEQAVVGGGGWWWWVVGGGGQWWVAVWVWRGTVVSKLFY